MATRPDAAAAGLRVSRRSPAFRAGVAALAAAMAIFVAPRGQGAERDMGGRDAVIPAVILVARHAESRKPRDVLAQFTRPAPRPVAGDAAACPQTAFSPGNQHLEFSPIAGPSKPGGEVGCTAPPGGLFDPGVVGVRTGTGVRIGIGKGGQIYSIRVPGIEQDLIPDQREDALYVDEVFQTVATHTGIRGASPRGRATKGAGPPGPGWHYHQAGAYRRGPLRNRPPLFSPLLFNRVNAAEGIYESLNLAQQAHVENEEYPPDRFLVYFRLRHAGNDVFEVTHSWLNYSGVRNRASGDASTSLNHFNVPWAILRPTAVPHVVADADGRMSDLTGQAWPTEGVLRNTRWVGAFAGGGDGAQGFAITMAGDLGNALRAGKTGARRVVTGGDPSRQFTYGQQSFYVVSALRADFTVARGEALVAQYFLVFGSRERVARLAGALHAQSFVRKTAIPASARLEDLAAFCRDASRRYAACAPGRPPDFLLTRRACTECVPLFELWDRAAGRHVYSTDPYIEKDQAARLTNPAHDLVGVLGWLWPVTAAVPEGHVAVRLGSGAAEGLLAQESDLSRYQYLKPR
jgi:hypothetical protein